MCQPCYNNTPSAGHTGQRKNLTQAFSTGSPPPGEAQAPPGALYIYPWLPLYFPSARTSYIKARLSLLSTEPSSRPSFGRTTKVEGKKRLDTEQGVKCLSTHLKQPDVSDRVRVLRPQGGKYIKEDKGNEKRGKTWQISILFSKTQLFFIVGMNMDNL